MSYFCLVSSVDLAVLGRWLPYFRCNCHNICPFNQLDSDFQKARFSENRPESTVRCLFCNYTGLLHHTSLDRRPWNCHYGNSVLNASPASSIIAYAIHADRETAIPALPPHRWSHHDIFVLQNFLLFRIWWKPLAREPIPLRTKQVTILNLFCPILIRVYFLNWQKPIPVYNHKTNHPSV